MNFYLQQFIYNSEFPDYEYFKEVFDKYENSELVNTYRKSYFKVFDKKLNSNYFSLYIRYGDSDIYSPDVVNIENRVIEENPRKPIQIELPNELFVIYVFKERHLLVSEMKKGLLKEILTIRNSDAIVIKNILKSYDEFLQHAKVLDEVHFAFEDDLFSNVDDFKNEISNILGFGTGRVSIKIDLKKPLNTKLKKRLNFLYNKLNEHVLTRMVCIGKDDDKFTSVFNSSNLTEKLEIGVDQDDNGFHEFRQILSEIEKTYNF